MTNLEILMADGCTRAEAERHLKNGSVVFEGEDFEKNLSSTPPWPIGELLNTEALCGISHMRCKKRGIKA